MIPRLSIVGYVDRQSVAPGDTLRVMVSHEGDGPDYMARLMRMHSFDDSAGGCGLIEEEVPAAFTGRHPGRRQTMTTGSCIVFDDDLPPLSGFTVSAWIWPTLPDGGDQTILACETAEGDGIVLALEDGRLALRVGTHRLGLPRPVLEREWLHVTARHDPATGRLRLETRPLTPWPGVNLPQSATLAMPAGLAFPATRLTVAARGKAPRRAHYNGKIDRLRLSADPDAAGLDAADPEGLADLLGFWDFSIGMEGVRVHDLSPAGRHGTTVNLPARAMTGHDWRAGTNDPRQAPHQYGAIHFHDDDVYDAGWEADFTWTVPDDLPSGAYAIRLENGDLPGYIVFFVRPPRHATGPRPKVLFLAPTAHYLAYANYRLTERDPMSEAYRGRLWTFGPEDVLLEHRPEFGNSMYERHSDGSGVCYSSYLRPVLNMRPNTRLSSLAGDGYVLAFLRHQGIAYDVLTDEDLDREGAACLAPYDVILTGGHPEYTSAPMWDALTAFLDRGGRLMYLGGNGFYWRVAFHPDLPGVMEVRRGEDGTRPWVAEVGEYHMSFTGEYGGLWRRNGRAPNTLVGVGFTAQGFDISTWYRRAPGADDPRAAFAFEGVTGEIIGDYGVGYGGAAGQEIDRYDRRLGSPPHALILASSEGHTDNMLLANEDLDATHLRVGGVENELVRADMVFFETMAGGAVFSTGSISWVAAMPWAEFDNDVARITANVLRRFMDPAPFDFATEG